MAEDFTLGSTVQEESPLFAGMGRGALFDWMGQPYTLIANLLVASWLQNTMSQLEDRTRRYCGKKSISISVQRLGMHASSLVLKDNRPSGPFTLRQWAYGIEVQIPHGGFKPRIGGAKAFLIQKPWGADVVHIRSRTYNRVGPGTYRLEGSGYLKQAMEETFTKPRLDVLSGGLAVVIGQAIAAKIKKAAEARGYVVQMQGP